MLTEFLRSESDRSSVKTISTMEAEPHRFHLNYHIKEERVSNMEVQ